MLNFFYNTDNYRFFKLISRVAAKIFVFVISRNLPRFSQNFAKHEMEIWLKISQFRESRNQNLGNILAILQEWDDFLTKKMEKIIFWVHNVHQSKWILIYFHLWVLFSWLSEGSKVRTTELKDDRIEKYGSLFVFIWK